MSPGHTACRHRSELPPAARSPAWSASSSCRRRLRRAARRCRRVNATPLGRPVVPDEYMMMQTSSGSTSDERSTGVASARQRLVLIAVAAPAGVTVITCSTFGSFVADLVDGRLQLRTDDQQLGTGVVEYVVHLVGGQRKLMMALAAPSDAAGERHLQAGGVVLVEERDHVTALDAKHSERACEPAHPVVPLGPRPGSVQVRHRLVVGLGGGPVGQSFIKEARDQPART